MRSRFILLALCLALAAHARAQSAAGAHAAPPGVGLQGPPSAASWLDRTPSDWNRGEKRLPRPASSGGAAQIPERCRGSVRQPESEAERALVRQGWTLYGPVQTYGLAAVVTAMSGVDGMCRPAGYQAFVYYEGRYAGTLSPVPMDSRADGSLTGARLVGPTEVIAEFARYRETDALCCPSRTSVVSYTLRPDEMPDLTPTDVTTRDNCRPGDDAAQGRPGGGAPTPDPGGGGRGRASALYGTRWRLVRMEDQSFAAGGPWIEFDAWSKRFSGDSGCNRVAGNFAADADALRLSRVIGTRRACLDPARQRAETAFVRLLETVTRYEAGGGSLRLYAGNRLILTFAGR